MQPDPSWATAWFVSSQIGEWNYERFSNAEYDKLHDIVIHAHWIPPSVDLGS